MTNWLLICHQKDTGLKGILVSSLQTVAKGIGVTVNEPIFSELKRDSADDFINAINANISRRPQIIICILPSQKKDRYDAVKQTCTVDLGIPSQCILSK